MERRVNAKRMKFIALTTGGFAVINSSDAAKVERFKWFEDSLRRHQVHRAKGHHRNLRHAPGGQALRRRHQQS